MLIKTMTLRVQANTETIKERANYIAASWAPTTAKSWTQRQFCFTDYDGRFVLEQTQYATILVEYYTTKKEGLHQLSKEGKKK